MAELGISIVENLIELIGSEIIKEICDMWNYKDHLADLNKTVSTIKNVLLDADAKRELTHAQRGFVEELKAAVYDADDLFDEFLTLAELQQIDGSNKHGKFSEKVRRFFSSSKKNTSQAYKMSRKVKLIKKQLDAIADKHLKFGFSVEYKPICRRREETCSYVDTKGIVGREEDKNAIIDLLLQHHNSTDNEGVRFLTIVGVGGLGKTALAQVVYNDDLIKNEFPDLRLWVCVSDQEGEQFDVKAILCKILDAITHEKFDRSSTMELVQYQFQKRLRGKKYFLVLDDVWNEDRENWLELENFLILGQEGSRIVVTTRSETTATIVGDKHAYKLKGLSQKDSWHLFEMSAFDKGCQQESEDELLEIGRKIVAKCSNVPLAIKVVGSLLFGQEISRWRSVEESGLADIGSGNNKIMSILKLSYHNLTPSLKSCFSYCALFPKDFDIRKHMLIDLWMAQGYIVPLDRGQSIEDAAEEQFAILLRRCFFQDVKRNYFGDDVHSVKIHDLMHDVAQEVGREEIRVVTSIANNLGDKIRHVYCVGDRCPQLISLCCNKIRSYISIGWKRPPVDDIRIDKWMCLRVLDLSNSNVGSLPESIGELLHLRYLDLSGNEDMEILPNAITRLHNLQTLLLRLCSSLRELPKDFCKLIKLRHLDLVYCDKLASMPSGMDKMTSLTLLPYFIVGERNSSEVISEDELKPLKALTNIKGDIWIKIGNNYKNVMNDKEGEGYLKNMKHLTHFYVSFDKNQQTGCVNHGVVLETLEPPSNLKGLSIREYSGITISKWGRADDNLAGSLSRLVYIKLDSCRNLKEMPLISKLPHLKSLELIRLDNVEYMENWSSSNTEAATIFFPSLQKLEFVNLEKLKGWWKGEPSVDDDHDLKRRFRFPCLSKLNILDCQNLTSFPSCTPSLEELRLFYNNEKLQIIVKTTGDEEINVKLRVASIENVGNLKSLPTNCLTRLELRGQYLEEESEKELIGEAFQSCASSLRELEIRGINNLKRLSGERGLEHFTVLESLTLVGDGDGDGEDKDLDDNTVLWKSFPQNLRLLTFKMWTSLPKGMQCLTSIQHLDLLWCYELKALPEWISSLSSLQSLSIKKCPALESLPEAMRNLTSLQSLEIQGCPKLKKRCKEPNGEDRPKIQHIPKIGQCHSSKQNSFFLLLVDIIWVSEPCGLVNSSSSMIHPVYTNFNSFKESMKLGIKAYHHFESAIRYGQGATHKVALQLICSSLCSVFFILLNDLTGKLKENLELLKEGRK